MDSDSRNNAVAFRLLDDLVVSGDFVGRIREGFLDLDSDHLGKILRINGWQAQALREHHVNRKSEDELFAGIEKIGRFLEIFESVHIPNAIPAYRSHQIPAMRRGRDERRLQCRLDNYSSFHLIICGVPVVLRTIICTTRVASPDFPTLTTRST